MPNFQLSSSCGNCCLISLSALHAVTLMARRQVADLVIKMFLSTKSAISLHETNVRLICKGRGSQGLGHLHWHWGGGNTKRCMLIELRGNCQPSIDASVGVDFLP